MEVFATINLIIGSAFAVCFLYQYVYLFVAIFFRPKTFPPAKPRRYAVLISARNEENVITQLIESIKAQDYPADMLDIHVVADNCTDNTALVAKEAGAFVVERLNKDEIGKGYALDFLLAEIASTKGEMYYDGYFVFDADNILSTNYVTEMHKVFSSGHKIVTSYRNVKNYGQNWLSACYSMWFLHECGHLNRARMILHTSSAISGTGFLMSRDILKRAGGWGCHLLTEDIEFSIREILHGEKIAYCDSAIFYDEQPTKLGVSFAQRLRWNKGYMQCIARYFGKLFKGVVGKNGFSCLDMILSLVPIVLFGSLSLAVNIVALIYSFFTGEVMVALSMIGFALLSAYGFLALMGLFTVLTEWKRIVCHPLKRFLYVLTFPFFMFTYVPITLVSLFSDVEWKPIAHGVNVTLDELQGKQKKQKKQKKEEKTEE